MVRDGAPRRTVRYQISALLARSGRKDRYSIGNAKACLTGVSRSASKKEEAGGERFRNSAQGSGPPLPTELWV